MTIRTTLFPMGYKPTGSPQPTGDTPGNLLGLAYCYEDYDDSDIVTETRINGVGPTQYEQEEIHITVKEDVFRYNVDLSNYSGSADKVVIFVDFKDILDTINAENGTATGTAIEVWLKTRTDKDGGNWIRPVDSGNGRTISGYRIDGYTHPEDIYKKDKTVITEFLLHNLDSVSNQGLYDIFCKQTILETI